MSSQESRINDLLERLQTENLSARSQQIPGLPSGPSRGGSRRPNRPNLQMDSLSNSDSPRMRPRELPFSPRPNNNIETDKKLKEIMKISGKLTIRDLTYMTDIKDLEHIEELGNGTCGHVVKMKHVPSKEIIAVKQMRRSGNSEENKRIIMDIEVVIKSHDCSYIVQCLGCFITDAEVWICMELMATCFDKLLKRLKQAVPEYVIGKVTVATVKALSYLKEKHGVMHRDVKPSNILLDERGNIKLCDFGISGRLVDSMAKSRSAGCAAYMAPERIEPNPKNPDYDIRADVWSLGITLVELATGEYPYQDCKTDFEVLTKVLEQDPPVLPQNQHFSPEFRQFVSLCLTKDPEQRPKYHRLQNEPFIKKYETENVNVGEWFQEAMFQADQLANTRALPRCTNSPLMSGRCQNSSIQNSLHITQTLMNGSSRTPPSSPQVLTNCYGTNLFKPLENQIKIAYQSTTNSLPVDGRSNHMSRYSVFHNSTYTPAGHQRDTSLYQSIPQTQQTLNQSLSPPTMNARGFSPFRVSQYSYLDGEPRYLPLSHGESVQNTSPYLQKRMANDNRRHSPIGSPLLGRNQNSEECIYGNTSPIVLQRFYHQQKQQQKVQEAEATKEDPGKRRYASYMKLQLSADRSGRLSRHQSPEPPPRSNRTTDNQSPLAAHSSYLDNNASPSLSRRFISPSPPVPPPRRLSESISVPGSPQHLRTRFRYTPEPQRRIYRHNNDISS